MPCRRCRSRSGKGSPGPSPEDAREFTPPSYHCGVRVAKRCHVSCSVCICVYVFIVRACTSARVRKYASRNHANARTRGRWPRNRIQFSRFVKFHEEQEQEEQEKEEEEEEEEEQKEGRAKKKIKRELEGCPDSSSLRLLSCDYRRQSFMMTMMLH